MDDSAEVRTLLSEVLRDTGYDVATACNGVEAVQAIEEGPSIDLVVSDVVMPEMGGVALVQESLRRWPELPLILMSGYAPDEATIEGVQRLHKPFAMSELTDVIAMTLQRAATARRSERSS